MLASDGVWEVMSSEHACGVVSEFLKKPGANAQDAAQPPLPLSGTLLGAAVDGPTREADKAAAVALANRSGLALLVLGDSERSCGEWGDRSSLSLPSDQPELLLREKRLQFRNLCCKHK